MSALDALIAELADAIADRVVDRMRGGQAPSDMVDQTQSELGPRRHCAHVRTLVAKGDPRAAIVGRRHYLKREAVTEELRRCSKRRAASESANDSSDVLAEELGLRVVGGRR